MGKKRKQPVVCDDFLSVYKSADSVHTIFENDILTIESREKMVWMRKRNVCSKNITNM